MGVGAAELTSPLLTAVNAKVRGADPPPDAGSETASLASSICAATLLVVARSIPDVGSKTTVARIDPAVMLTCKIWLALIAPAATVTTRLVTSVAKSSTSLAESDRRSPEYVTRSSVAGGNVGALVGASVGAVGAAVGAALVGAAEGTAVGVSDGTADGVADGSAVGAGAVGIRVGTADGAVDGVDVGVADGTGVGPGVSRHANDTLSAPEATGSESCAGENGAPSTEIAAIPALLSRSVSKIQLEASREKYLEINCGPHEQQG